MVFLSTMGAVLAVSHKDDLDDDFDPERVVALPIDGVLDLHTFHPRDVSDLVPTWIDECRAQGLRVLRIVHGKGQGVLRRTVHAIPERRADVESFY